MASNVNESADLNRSSPVHESQPAGGTDRQDDSGPQRAWLFIHIRKTAGTSVRAALMNRFAVNRTQLDWHYVRNRARSPDQFQFVTGHCPYTVVERFTVPPRVLVLLRDPIERALSAFDFYRYATPAQIQDYHDVLSPEVAREREYFSVRSAELGLLRFLESEAVLARRWLGDVQTRVLAGAAETDPDLPLHGRPLLDVALRNLRACDCVGITERLADSLSMLGRMDPRLRDLPAPQLNRTAIRQRRSDVSQPALDILTEWNQLDAELYRAGIAQAEAQLRSTGAGECPDEAHSLYPDGEDFTFDQAIIGSGWNAREVYQGQWICWTGPECIAELRFQLQSDSVRSIHCCVESVLAADVLAGLRLRVNGHELNWQRTERDGRVWIVADLPTAALRGGESVTTLQFETPRTIRPIDLNPDSGDDRRLGVALSRVQFRAH